MFSIQIYYDSFTIMYYTFQGIVIDNASYHSCSIEEYPIYSWTKKRLMDWKIEIAYFKMCKKD